MPRDFKCKPSKDYPFFLYDADDGILMYYRTIEDRDDAAKGLLARYLEDNEWLDSTEQICTGRVTHIVLPLNDNPEVDGYDYGLVEVAC